jgi:hypothetical protein
MSATAVRAREPYPGVPTLVRNVTVFDGEGGRIEHGAVLFASGKVVEVGQDIAAPAGRDRVERRPARPGRRRRGDLDNQHDRVGLGTCVRHHHFGPGA